MADAAPSRRRALLALLRPDARRWVGLGALVAVGAALALAGPLVIRRVVDRAGDGATAGELVRLAVLFLLIAVVTQVLAVAVVRRATVIAWDTTNELRMRITRHVLGLDHEFHRRHTPGELIQRVDGDVTSVSELLGRVVPTVAGGGLLVAGIVVVLSVLDWRLGPGTLIFVVGAVVVIAAGGHQAIDEPANEL
ncbi:MAG: ABC transporter transmembrane domain-containing protein, partial [Ilumatobacteraceae bacterium]